MMTEQAKKFSAPDFNADKYVKEISQVCVGGLELQQHKAKIQSLAEETSQTLKRNVYQNYMQFIETAREISHLEGEMYQLSHLLGEQRVLLGGMSRSPQGGRPPELDLDGEEEKKKEKEGDSREARLAAITEKVEGCISLLDTPARDLVHDDNLVELDPVENTALHRCHAFLLTDILIITTWISNRRGPAKYRFEGSYEVQGLAVVNVRDLGNVRHAFKLLVFPETRLFQCANAQAKVDWLEKLEAAKKARVTKEQPPNQPEPKSPIRADSVDSGSNPFGSWEEVEGFPEWVEESPEDLAACIAQRHFEQAYSLAQKTYTYLESHPNPDIKAKVDTRVKSLTQALLSELTVSAEKSLQGGLRASRRAVRLLNQLGKSNQACGLYLKVCSGVVKAGIKRVKREGPALAYARRLTPVFFSTLASITTEFQTRAFPNCPSCSSAFVVWASMEVSHFTTHLIKQIFVPQTPLSTLAESIDILRKQCEQVTELGVDVGHQVEGQLSGPVGRAVSEACDKHTEAIKLRCSQDTWVPAPQSLAQRLPQELLSSPQGTGGCEEWPELTGNTLAFARLYSSLMDDVLTLWTPDLELTLSKVIYQVFDSQLKHVAASLKLDRLQPQKALIQRNASFLMDCLLRSCTERYQRRTGHRSKKLEQLRAEYTPVLKESTKISVTGYI